MTDVYGAINEFGKLVGSKNEASANVFYRWQELRPLIEALQAECGTLRERLDAQERGLAALAALARRRGDNFWLNALTKELLSIAAARTALGIGDDGEDA